MAAPELFLLTPLREGRLVHAAPAQRNPGNFYSRPCGRGDMIGLQRAILYCYFYSRPCGRGDSEGEIVPAQSFLFLLTPLREGRPCLPRRRAQRTANFYSRPCGRGDGYAGLYQVLHADDFYSRPCGRGDGLHACEQPIDVLISTHAPAGGATSSSLSSRHSRSVFLLTPLREGRQQFSTSPS